MLSLLLVTLLAQVPCAPFELSAICRCKQGVASACDVVRQTNPKLAEELTKAFEIAAAQAQVMESRAQGDSRQQEKEAASSDAQASSSAPEPPDCKGQWHHVISKPIAKALKDHLTLGGLYTPRDPRFVAKAKDEAAHCGYQQWHRDVDKEVIAWLAARPKVTPEQFMKFLREIYSRPAMRERFPHGF
jgi:hypothetical protein